MKKYDVVKVVVVDNGYIVYVGKDYEPYEPDKKFVFNSVHDLNKWFIENMSAEEEKKPTECSHKFVEIGRHPGHYKTTYMIERKCSECGKIIVDMFVDVLKPSSNQNGYATVIL